MTMASFTADEVPWFHTVGIGAGPANLSLAALFEAVAPHRIALFDRQPGPAWHPDLLFPGVRMQTSWLKDLVCLVEPCHRLTFLNYLVSTGRLFALLNSQYGVIPREEYARYLAWAGEQLEDVHYGTAVDRVSFDDGFHLHSGSRPLARSDHLVLGIGSVPATVYKHDLARSLLGYPADHHCEFLLSFGYPADVEDLTRPLRAGGRRPLDELVHEERW